MFTTLAIFRAGTHTANSGQSIAFSEADLEATVKAYDPARHEAPLVVGHPKADAPAYGWVKALAFSDGEVSAEPHQVQAEFEEMVNSGRFKKISASFYLPDAPQNPVPGVYYLRHVGFLGAQPPAVKGLKDAQFADGEAGVIEFDEWTDRDIADLLQGLREWFIGKYGLEEADNALPSWPIESLKERAVRESVHNSIPEPDPATPEALADAVSEAAAAVSEMAAAIEAVKEEIDEIGDSKSPEYSEVQKAKDALKAKAAELANLEKSLQAKALEVKSAETLAFCEELSKTGRIPPRHAKGLAAFMYRQDDISAVDFGEALEETPLAWFKKFLQSLPKQVEFTELKNDPPPLTTVDFTVAPGYTVDMAGLELHKKATDYQKAHPGIEFYDAVKAVS